MQSIEGRSTNANSKEADIIIATHELHKMELMEQERLTQRAVRRASRESDSEEIGDQHSAKFLDQKPDDRSIGRRRKSAERCGLLDVKSNSDSEGNRNYKV